MPRRVFTDEFRQRAIRLARQPGTSVGSVATELGITDTTLRNWIKADTLSTTGGTMAQSALQQQVRELQSEVAKLRMERDILKKATAFFAKVRR